MRSTILWLSVLMLQLVSIDLFAVDGFKEYKFGMPFEEAQKMGSCDWKKQDPSISGMMIFSNKRAALFKCENYVFENRSIELYLEFIDNTLQRIILDVSSEEQSNQERLEQLKDAYGLGDGELLVRGRSKQYTFENQGIEVEIYAAPINLMFVRFYSKNYQKLIRQPYLKGLTS